MSGTIELPALHRAGDLLPATINEEDRSIEVVWSTGSRVRRQPLFGEPFDEELSMDPASVRLERLNAGGPVLKVHDTRSLDSVIGSVIPGSARVDNGRGIARVRFSDREDVAPIWSDISGGHIRAVSIGYQVHRYDVTRSANGPEVWRAVDWTPFEISAVPVGADPAAGFRSIDPLIPCLVKRDEPRIENSQPLRTAMEEIMPVATPPVSPPPMQPKPETAERTIEPNNAERPVEDTQTLVARAQIIERERVGTIYDLASRLGLERNPS